jgi:hypothetical protein
MADLVAPSGGAKGVDISTPNGTRTYDANKQGVYKVDNPTDVKQMLANGFTTKASFGYSRSRFGELRCAGEKCFYLGSYVDYVCPRCGFENKTGEVLEEVEVDNG